MKHRSLLFLLFCAFWLALCAGFGSSQASPLSRQAVPSFKQNGSPLVDVGYDGCGWDYPCPPRPDYGRRPSYRSGQVYIQNNYGTVNVYENRRHHWTGASEVSRPCCFDGERPGWKRNEVVEERDCGPNPCEGCGPFCWYRRFKEGYCGHGCGVYREKVRFERGERSVVYPRPAYRREDPLPPPEYGPGYAEEAPAEYWHPHDADPVPRRRFDGPKYPPN
jgi:hypothetical protein